VKTVPGRGQLAAITGAVPASFAYDALGRRAGATSGGTTRQYVYDDVQVVSEVRAGGTVAFLLGPTVDEWLVRTDASGAVSFLPDGIGSGIGVLDSAGALVGASTYEPFGATRNFGVSDAQGRFTGREQDSEHSYYYRARYYDPEVGRFLSEDPAGGDQAGNAYAYVENDPVNAIDPSGLTKVEVCCRGLLKTFAGIQVAKMFRHCYIKLTEDDGQKQTYGILGNKDSSKNQIPRTGDNLGKNPTDRNSGGEKSCQPVPGSKCQIEKLRNGLNAAVVSGTCPSCGDNYKRYTFNSNTWVYNMILGAGMTPPGMGRAPGYHQAAGAWYPE
jgi:RHS repeat-associated protein